MGFEQENKNLKLYFLISRLFYININVVRDNQEIPVTERKATVAVAAVMALVTVFAKDMPNQLLLLQFF